MSIYLDKLAHIRVVINCPYSVAQMCTREDTLALILGSPYFDGGMSYDSLTTTGSFVHHISGNQQPTPFAPLSS